MYAQVEEFGRDMYKLNKKFISKAKQKARDKDKDKEKGGGIRRDMKDETLADKAQEFAPLKLATLALDGVKEFKVHCTLLLLFVSSCC